MNETWSNFFSKISTLVKLVVLTSFILLLLKFYCYPEAVHKNWKDIWNLLINSSLSYKTMSKKVYQFAFEGVLKFGKECKKDEWHQKTTFSHKIINGIFRNQRRNPCFHTNKHTLHKIETTFGCDLFFILLSNIISAFHQLLNILPVL